MKVLCNRYNEIFGNIDEIIVGIDSEFYWENGIQRTLSFQLYIEKTDHEILIDSEFGAVSFNDIIQLLTRYYPDLQKVALVGHFNRAEFSAMEDGRDLLLGKNFFESSKTIAGKITLDGLVIDFYDTNHFFHMSLDAIGENLGIPKVDISPYPKDKMDILYREQPELFRNYAMTDAKIVAKAMTRMLDLTRTHLCLTTLPKTAGAVGSRWIGQELKQNPDRARRLGYYINSKTEYKRERKKKTALQGNAEKPKENGKLHKYRILGVKRGIESKFKDAYYGGRNEVFIRGLIPDLIVSDLDLISAYTTSQSALGEYDFDPNSETCSIFFNNPEDCYQHLTQNPFDFGYVNSHRLKHRADVRFPVIPSKVEENGIFTAGESDVMMTSHEFLVAYPTFDVIEGFQSVIYRRVSESSIVSEFQQKIRNLRDSFKEAGDKFANLFFKEIGNSTYGKFYQGYAEKNAISFKSSSKDDTRSKEIPKSEISNPFIASWITGLIRAIAFETLNELDKIGMKPLCWTTDGFTVGGEVPEYIISGQFGVLSKIISDLMQRRSGSGTLYELKHKGRGWLGIKNRAYTMLESIPGHRMLISVSGIQTKNWPDKSKSILDEYKALVRFKDTKYESTSLTSIRAWIEGDEYENHSENKSYNWDFDFKRLPDRSTVKTLGGHLYFETLPHPSAESFTTMKSYYHAFKRSTRKIIKKDDNLHEYTEGHFKNKIISTNDLIEFLDYCNDRESCEDGYVTELVHLKHLANFIKYKSMHKLGYRKIAKLLHSIESTVKNRWLRKEISVTRAKAVLTLITRKYSMGPAIVDILINGSQFDIKGIYKANCVPPPDEKSIISMYEGWSLTHLYSVELFTYVIEYILWLNNRVYKGTNMKIVDGVQSSVKSGGEKNETVLLGDDESGNQALAFQEAG